MKNEVKRLIALGGGGPAVGLALGVLKRMSECQDIRFDVWTTACAGAWLGMAYNVAPEGKEYENALRFCQNNMRPDNLNASFPIPAQFVPDFMGMIENTFEYLKDPKSLEHLNVPQYWPKALHHMIELMTDQSKWTKCEINPMILNDILAVNPISRLMISVLFRSGITGLARMYYDDCKYKENALIYSIDEAFKPGRPVIYHNAYNLTDCCVELFVNSTAHPKYKPMSMKSLRAGSALPYIIEPIELDGKMYCEGAMVDTINFKDIIRNHPDLDEIWVVRLLNLSQIKAPKSLLDSLNNLIMLFAASMSEDAISMLRFRLEKRRMRTRVIEVPVMGDILYEWSESNLEQSIEHGYREADSIVGRYKPRYIMTPQFNTMKVITRRASAHTTIGDEHLMSETALYAAAKQSGQPFKIIFQELASIVAMIVPHMDIARKSCDHKMADEVQSYEDEMESRAVMLTDALEILYSEFTDFRERELAKICINLTELIYALSRDAAEFILNVIAYSGNDNITSHSRNFIESIDITLMTLEDTLKEPSAENFAVIMKMAYDRSGMMIDYRNDFLAANAGVSSKEVAEIFVLTDLAEKFFDNVLRVVRKYERYINYEKHLK
ncbi:MAG: patatin-like phospholipase family protein [Nitrospirota bacterium]